MKNKYITDIETATSEHDIVAIEEFSNIPDPKKPFSFNLSKDKMERLRKYVALRRKNPLDFHYNNSMALREGIDLMRLEYPTLRRPREVKNPIRLGRPYLLTSQEKKIKTSFIISEADRQYIYDFIFKHYEEEDFFGKENFFGYALKMLENKNKKKATK